jgi:hypothetical protein
MFTAKVVPVGRGGHAVEDSEITRLRGLLPVPNRYTSPAQQAKKGASAKMIVVERDGYTNGAWPLFVDSMKEALSGAQSANEVDAWISLNTGACREMATADPASAEELRHFVRKLKEELNGK